MAETYTNQVFNFAKGLLPQAQQETLQRQSAPASSEQGSSTAQQVVRYSKLTAVKLSQLQNLLPSDRLASYLTGSGFGTSGGNGIVGDEDSISLLCLATDKSIQLWAIDASVGPNGEGLDCLYCKLVPDIFQVDFLHLTKPASGVGSQMLFSHDHDLGTQPQIYDCAPLLGYIAFENKTQLNIFSVVAVSLIKTFVTPCPIRKFQTHITNPNNRLIVLQLDGTLQVVNLVTMEIENQLKTFCLDPKLLSTFSSDSPAQQVQDASSIGGGDLSDSGLPGERYDGTELRTKTDLLLMSAGFPIDIDVTHNLCAFVYTEINQNTMMESLLKSLDQSSLGKNMYIKAAASKLVHFGHSSLETINNLLNVNKAKASSQLESQHGGGASESNPQSSFVCTCNKTKRQLSQLGVSQSISQSASFSRQTASQMGQSSMNSTAPKVSQPKAEKPTVHTENQMTVRIHDLADDNFDLFAEITPPFLKYISLVKFSPSGRRLLLGNEAAQYFYVYDLIPESGYRFTQPRRQQCFCSRVKTRLSYTLFRGYRPAEITDCQFVRTQAQKAGGNANGFDSEHEEDETVILNSSNGTSHVFRLENLNKLTPISKGNSVAAPAFRIQNLVSSTTYKYNASGWTGGQGDVRMVSQVIRKVPIKGDINSKVISYNSHNELFSYDLKETSLQPGAPAQSQSPANSSGTPTALDQDEIKFKQMVEGSQNIERQKKLQVCNVNKVVLNIQTLKADNIKEMTTDKIFYRAQYQRESTSAASGVERENWLSKVEPEPFYPSLMMRQAMNSNFKIKLQTDDYLRASQDQFHYDLDAEMQLAKEAPRSSPHFVETTQIDIKEDHFLVPEKVPAKSFDTDIQIGSKVLMENHFKVPPSQIAVSQPQQDKQEEFVVNGTGHVSRPLGGNFSRPLGAALGVQSDSQAYFTDKEFDAKIVWNPDYLQQELTEKNLLRNLREDHIKKQLGCSDETINAHYDPNRKISEDENQIEQFIMATPPEKEEEVDVSPVEIAVFRGEETKTEVYFCPSPAGDRAASQSPSPLLITSDEVLKEQEQILTFSMLTKFELQTEPETQHIQELNSSQEEEEDDEGDYQNDHSDFIEFEVPTDVQVQDPANSRKLTFGDDEDDESVDLKQSKNSITLDSDWKSSLSGSLFH